MIKDRYTNEFFAGVGIVASIVFAFFLAFESYNGGFIPLGDDKQELVESIVDSRMSTYKDPNDQLQRHRVRTGVVKDLTEKGPRSLGDYWGSCAALCFILLLVGVYLIFWSLENIHPMFKSWTENKLELSKIKTMAQAEIDKIEASAQAEIKIRYSDPKYSPRES